MNDTTPAAKSSAPVTHIYDGAHYLTLTRPGSEERTVQYCTRGAASRAFNTLRAHEPTGTQIQVYPGVPGEVDANLPILWT